MSFILKPTLEHVALVKLVTSLWNNHDIRSYLDEFVISGVLVEKDAGNDLPFYGAPVEKSYWATEKINKWEVIESKVVEKISHYKLHKALKDKMEGYVKPIGIQILHWLEYHRRCFCLDLKIPSEFQWTAQGTIDKQKTAKILLSDGHIDIVTRYNLACIYCLEDDIPELLNKVPEDRKVIHDDIEGPNRVPKVAILKFWANFVFDYVHWDDIVKITEYSDSDDSRQAALRSAAGMANKAAIEYFLQKVQSKEEHLLEIATAIASQYYSSKYYYFDPPRECYSEVLWSLLSEMNESQQLIMLKTSGPTIMSSLLDWPMQSFFVETASHLCEIHPHCAFIVHFAVKAILRKFNLGYKDYNYEKLFEDLWQKLSDNHKKCIISDSGFYIIVGMLLVIKYRGNIKLMLEDASITERKSLIFSHAGFVICCEMAGNDEWDLLKFFIELCIFSKDEMILFTEKLTDFLTEKITEILENSSGKMDEIICFLNNLVCTFNKRETEREFSMSKRFCKK